MTVITSSGNLKASESIVSGHAVITSKEVIDALDKIKEVPKQAAREMRQVIEDMDISVLQDLIDYDWGVLTEWAELLIKLLSG